MAVLHILQAISGYTQLKYINNTQYAITQYTSAAL